MGQDLVQRRKISASLQLMQDLLTCPAGEEWILLKRHEEVVDAEFVQLMDQVAAQLQQEGDRHAATFLRNWAAQLHHVLLKEAIPYRDSVEPSPAHLALIQQLIQQPEKVDGILAQSGDLIQPELVQVIHRMAQQLWAQGDRETAQVLEQIAVRANHAWIQRHMPTSQPSESTGAIGLPEPERPTSDQSEPDQSEPEQPGLERPEMRKTAAQTTMEAAQQPGGPKTRLAPPAAAPPPSRQGSQPIPDPWQSETPMSSALQLKVPQQIANGLHEVTLLMHELNKAIAAQTTAIQALTSSVMQTDPAHMPPENPLWYMEVLERAHELDWILSTDELVQLTGVKPQCHGDETRWVRGCWQFEKVGKLGPQIGWRVHKC